MGSQTTSYGRRTRHLKTTQCILRGYEWGLVFSVICPHFLVFAVIMATFLMFTVSGKILLSVGVFFPSYNILNFYQLFKNHD